MDQNQYSKQSSDKSSFFQVQAIFWKNLLCSFRNKEFLAESLIPLLCGGILAIKDADGTQLVLLLGPLILALAVYSNPKSLLIHLCEEKELKFKETQKIMGLKQNSYLIGWMLYAYAKTIMSTIIFFASWLIVGYLVNHKYDRDYMCLDNGTEWYVILGIFSIYVTTLVHFSMLLTTFFSKSKTANEITTFLLVISLILPYLGFVEKFQTTFFFVLISIFPQTCMALVYMSTQYGLYRSVQLAMKEYFTLDYVAIELSITSVVFLMLYFYFDSILPNEYGIAKHPLFFLNFKKTADHHKVDLESSLLDKYDNAPAAKTVNQDFSSAFYHEERNYLTVQPSVKIRGIVKRFGNFTAVDQVSLNLYSREILCLLGHNGAGKTTTINVLTGLLSLTQGQVYVDEEELENNLEQIREKIGICNQRDVLYEELTVQEQLEFMGRLKGLSGNNLIREINEIARTTFLTNELKKITKTLSGGNKRKLSLAQAIIGGSKVLFLDEPTSGMDAQTRRGIWEILIAVKEQNRTLVLTTHHLDEAEELADRIAIMAAGKLLACGRSEYIKQNFGEGYQISITILDKSINKDDIINFTQQHLPQAIIDPQSSQYSILLGITFQQKKYLSSYFTALEQQYQQRLSVNFRINSLEDAFINIGMDEEKFLERAKNKNHRRTSINREEDSFIQPNNFVEQQAQVDVPDCLNREPIYSFKEQTQAIYYRKYYTTIRTFSNYLAIVIPFTLIIAGIIIIGEMDLGEEDSEQTRAFRMIFFAFFALIAFCFNSSLFITQPVLERETNLKYALVAMGCRPIPYWFGTFLFDFTIYLGMTIIIILTSLLYEYMSEHIGKIIFIFLTFGVSFIVFSYLIGTALYEKSSKAMKTFPFLNYFVFFALFINIWVIVAMIFMFSNEEKDVKDLTDGQSIVIKIVDLLCACLSPFYSMFQSFTKIIGLHGSVPTISDQYWVYCIIMAVQSIVFFYLNMFIEAKKYNNIRATNQRCHNYIPAKIEDPEVQSEIQQIENGTKITPIKILHLQKQYNTNLLAVKDITFGVKRNEILGLLGPNGAGKSTTFNILTSLIGKTSGKVEIKQVEIDRSQADVFRDTGICPQFDCLWDNLTPREHLYLFGRMKGLNGKDLDQSVSYFLNTMQLEEYIYRKAGDLSGGNKRKLCVSNALIGGPSIQFFDEPSTGVDPIARRFLWKTLRKGVKLRESSVVLTTHTMDEAESLCDRIAIMINGEIFCLGNPKELRDRYGEGFNIQIRHPSNRDAIMITTTQQFTLAKDLKDTHEDYMTIHIPTSQFQFYRVFEFLTELEKNNMIKDFTINQSTLESVFLQFSQLQQQIVQL